MKTTVDMPEALLRRAKAEAPLRGRKLKELIVEGLKLVLDEPHKTTPAHRKPSVHDLLKPYYGVFDSGIKNLGSNSKHLEGFGDDSLGHR